MRAKPVIPRDIAYRDVNDAIDYYFVEAGAPVALRFNDAVESIYRAISARPEIGSRRDDNEPRFHGLRSRRVKRFPYLVLYVERPEHIDVVRVLHAQRDVVALLDGTPD